MNPLPPNLFPLRDHAGAERLFAFTVQALGRGEDGAALLLDFWRSRPAEPWKSLGLVAMIEAGCKPYEAASIPPGGLSCLAHAISERCSVEAIDTMLLAGADPHGDAMVAHDGCDGLGGDYLFRLAGVAESAAPIVASLTRHGARVPRDYWVEVCEYRQRSTALVEVLLSAGADPFLPLMDAPGPSSHGGDGWDVPPCRAIDVLLERKEEAELVQLAGALVQRGERELDGSVLHAWMDAALDGHRRESGTSAGVLTAFLDAGADWGKEREGQSARERFGARVADMRVRERTAKGLSTALVPALSVPEIAALAGRFEMEKAIGNPAGAVRARM